MHTSVCAPVHSGTCGDGGSRGREARRCEWGAPSQRGCRAAGHGGGVTQTRFCLGLGVWGGWLRSDLVRWSHLAWLVATAGMDAASGRWGRSLSGAWLTVVSPRLGDS